MASIAGQQSLNNFYQSVLFNNPNLAQQISDDVITVSLYGLAADKLKSPGQEAADRLRRSTYNLPEIHRRVLNNALIELGYS
jgi:hypothetical protein